MSEDTTAKPQLTIPRTVWALGLVSFFMDVSSETIHAILPLFLTTTLGASVALVGLIDGVAEATASITKVFSGYISDRLGRRKPLILLGYALGAISKPLFALATAPYLVFGARFADRIGKGMRGAPRDALVADITPESIRGRAFGLRQAMDTAGAFVGPLLAIGLMALMAGNMRLVFWFAVIPAALAVLCVLIGVEDHNVPPEEKRSKPPIRFSDLRGLTLGFWGVVAIGVIFTLARFSEAFLILRASDVGLPLALAPLVLVVMNAVYSIGAYPSGALSDKIPARFLLIAGLIALIGADASLALLPNLIGAFVGITLWGVHMALTQGLFAKLVAAHAPADLRASAFGVFNLATGIALLIASVIAGILWDRFGPEATFIAGACFAVIAGALLLIGTRNTPARDSSSSAN